MNLQYDDFGLNRELRSSFRNLNESFDQTEEIEPEKLLLKSSEPLLDMPIDWQL